MKLEDFVSETLEEVFRGVQKAQTFAREAGGAVVPRDLTYYKAAGGELMDSHGNAVGTVDFDVAVTTTEGSSAKGGVGVFVGPIGAGTQGQLDSSNQSMSRIRFSIPVALPVQ